MIPCRPHGPKTQATGFSLVELMVAMTLTLFVVLAVATLFTNNSAARREIDSAGQQIENGRYAMDLIRDDVRLAGYYGEFVPTSPVSWQLPTNPCDPALAKLGWDASARNVPVGISGYEGHDAAIDAMEPQCISNRLPGSDVLVVRRASTKALPAPPTATNTPFLQVSLQTPLCTSAEQPFVVDVVQSNSPFTLHRKDKDCPTDAKSLSLVRQYLVHIYYVSTCDDCIANDRIPTLKRVELGVKDGASKMIESSLAQGIADFRIEYGQDTGNDGFPEAYAKCGAGTCTAADWANVMTVKVYLLTRNMEPTPGYADNKTYDMGLSGTLAASALSATERTYKHHVYASPIRVTGQSDLRELP